MAQFVGVDVGGTFTDLIWVDDAHAEVRLAKVPTTVHNQAHGVVAALAAARADVAALEAIVHGTTTTTNAMLERKVACVGLITTQGFRDVLELGRRTRPTPYGLKGQFRPLVERHLRLEVPERLDAQGQVLTPLDEAAVRAAVARLRALGAESLVIHFLHSYLNPAHERRAEALVRELWPEVHLTVGHRIVAEYREYERGVTAAVNAAVQPVLARYLQRLKDELAAQGYAKELLVMQGNGGTVASGVAVEGAVNTVMSGPASGVIAAASTGLQAGFERLITYDMGGTSTDVALVIGGVPTVSSELELEYAMPIHVPMVDVHTIGAGGGSLASVGADGLLRVGPQSAGATPGPICFGRGGSQPTITDANLLLGRLNPQRLLAVDSPVTPALLEQAFEQHAGRALGLDATATAAAVLRVANDKMAGAIRMVSLSRGHDPRDFALFAFGGAGPLHATALARELNIPAVLVPARPGLTNALGCVLADLRHDRVSTLNLPLAQLPEGRMAEVFAQQEAQGRALLQRDAVAVEGVRLLRRADMQFQGQSHILSVAVDDPAMPVAELAARFEAAYWQRFGVRLADIRPVLVNLHTAVIGLRPKLGLAMLLPEAPGATVEGAQRGTRNVWFDGGWCSTPVFAREALPRGAVIEGPAVLEQLDSTTVLEPGNRATVDALGNLVIEVNPS